MKKLIFLLIAVLLCGCSQNKTVTVTDTVNVTSTSAENTSVPSVTTVTTNSFSEETIVSATISETVLLSQPTTESFETAISSEEITASETTVAIKPIPSNTTEETTYVDDEPNPGQGFNPKNDIIIKGNHYAPYFSGLFKKENGKFYIYNFDEGRKIFAEGENGDIELKNHLFGGESEYMYDIVNNYEPIGTAVYRKEIENNFETNMKELDGTQIYFFDEHYPEDETENHKMLKFLLVGTEPFITIDGVELYVYTTDFGAYVG